MQGGQNFILHQQAQHQTTSRAVSHTAVSSTTPSENDDEGIGSSLADLDSLTDLLPMMAPDLVRIFFSCWMKSAADLGLTYGILFLLLLLLSEISKFIL